MDPAKFSIAGSTVGTCGSLPAVRAACHRALAARDHRINEYPHWEATWRIGPSPTADLEKVLVLGAQGPQELHLVLYRTED